MTVLAEQFLFDLGPLAREAFRPRYNIAPTQSVPVVRLADGKRQLAMLHWGLIPPWATDKKIAYSTINARGDTVASKPAFRSAYKRRRCLVLADGYFEWEKAGKVKLPWLYELKDQQPFAFAGLWECWQPEGADSLESCTIITTEANELASQFHDRMPVILDPADHNAWLAGEEVPLIPYPPDRMTVRPVSTTVNNVRNSGPECIDPRMLTRSAAMFRFTIWNLLVLIYFAGMGAVFASHVLEAMRANAEGRKPRYFTFPSTGAER